MTSEQRTAENRFNPEPYLLDWTGHGGSPFEVARVGSSRSMISLIECDLTIEGARALRDWLNKVIP